MKSLKSMRWESSRPMKAGELGEAYRSMRSHFGPLRWWPGETPFEVIVGAILTQNTAWTNVEKAIKNLKQAKVLTPEKMYRLTKRKLASLIRSAGYFNIKADRLKQFLDFMFERYDGNLKAMQKVPLGRLRRELLSVKGIGPETADSILLYALGKRSFVIDAYTRRVFTRHKLAVHSVVKKPHDKLTYEDWQKVFTASIPPKIRLYNDYHAQIVMIAKDFCKSRRPLCEHCPLHSYL